MKKMVWFRVLDSDFRQLRTLLRTGRANDPFLRQYIISSPSLYHKKSAETSKEIKRSARKILKQVDNKLCCCFFPGGASHLDCFRLGIAGVGP